MIKIDQWLQNNRSDTFGSIWASFGIDLGSNKGKIRPSVRAIVNDTNVDSDFNAAPCAFAFFTRSEVGSAGIWWMLAGDNLYRMNSVYTDGTWEFNNLTWTDTAPLGFDHTVGDLKVFGAALWFTTLRDMGKVGASGNATVPLGDNPLSQTYVHMLEVYAGRMYVTEQNTKVWSTDGSTLASSSSNTLALKEQFRIITCLKAVSDGLWVFTINQAGQQGKIYKWDGTTADDPNTEYTIESAGVISAVIKDDVPYAVTNDGRIIRWNGGVFTEIARFPVDQNRPLKNSLSAVNDRWLNPNSMVVVDDKIQFLVRAEYEDGSRDERFPSGIWELDLSNNNLYHKTPISTVEESDEATDYAQMHLAESGALYNSRYYTRTTQNGNILIGGSYYSNATTSVPFVGYDDVNEVYPRFMSFVTQKIYSQEVMDKYVRAYIRHKDLLSSTDELSLWYRTKEVDPVEATITWVDNNSFTTTTDVSAYEGYQVEVLHGQGGGICAKITSVTNNGGTYTVVIDHSFSVMLEGTAKARFQFWKKSFTTGQQNDSYSQFPIGAAGTWIQLKVTLKSTGTNEIDDVLLVNEPHKMV